MLSMSNAHAVKSDGLGRKPSDNPKSIHLGIRVDEATAEALDAEIARLKKVENLDLGRSDIVRKLITEALAARIKRSR